MTKKDTKNALDLSKSDILDDLDDLDRAIIKYKLDGFNNNEIAKKTSKNRQTIALRFKKVKVQQAIDELQKSALQILIDSQNEAARTLRQIMRNRDSKDTDRIAASKEILKGVLSDKVNHSGEINVVYLDEQDKDL